MSEITSDFIRLALDPEGRDIFVNAMAWNGEWPPPETIELAGLTWRRESYSQLPEGLPHVARGALYCLHTQGASDVQ